MTIVGIDEAPSRVMSVDVDPDKLKTIRVYVSQPLDQIKEGETFKFIVKDIGGSETDTYVANFNIPEAGK